MAPTKKSAQPKKRATSPVKRSKVEIEEPVVREAVETKTSAETPSKSSTLRLALIVSLIVVAGLAYMFRGLFVVAMVNNQPISRLQVLRELEKADGKAVVSNIVKRALIEQEANNKKIVVTDADVNAQIKKLETTFSQQGQTLDAALSANGMTRNDLKDQLKIQAKLEKLVGGPDVVTDAEVDAAYESSKSQLPEGTKMEDAKANLKLQLQDQKAQQKVQKYLADLEKKAKVNYFVTY